MFCNVESSRNCDGTLTNKQTPLNKALSKGQLFSKCKKPIWYSILYYWNWRPSCLTHRVFFKFFYTQKLANISPQKNQNYSNVTRKTSNFFCQKKQKSKLSKCHHLTQSLWLANQKHSFLLLEVTVHVYRRIAHEK